VRDCPSEQQWRRYLCEQVSSDEDRALTDHVEGCPACETLLAGLMAAAGPCPTTVHTEPEPPTELMTELRQMWDKALAVNPHADPAFWPKLEGYDILGVLGQGGLGVVYRARQRDLDREVAVKMIAAGDLSSPSEIRRLLNDAATGAQLRHEHIVPVYSVGQCRGLPYCVMELIAGGSLAQRLPDLVSEPRETARLMAQVARALHHAHRQGICHRDVKPANILLRIRAGEGLEQPLLARTAVPLTRLDACLTDFGVARRTREDAGLTPTGAVVGTPGYMAPEQIRSEHPTPAADLFGLGAVLYECLTGQPPFRGATPYDALLLTLHEEPKRPRLLNYRISRDLETICLKCLEREPQARYASAAALAEDLERWLHGDPVRARRVGYLGRTWRRCRRAPIIAGLSAVLVLALVSGITGVLYQWRQAERARQSAVASDAEARQLLSALIQSNSVSPWFIDTPKREPRIAPLREAELHCLRLLERDPEDAEMRIALTNVRGSLGTLYNQRGKPVEALAYLQGARELWVPLVQQSPRNPVARHWLANTHLWMALAGLRRFEQEAVELQQAQSLWLELLEEQPDNLLLWEDLAQCHYQLRALITSGAGRDATRATFDTSYRLLGEQLTDQPDSRSLRIRLGLLALLLGDIERWNGTPERTRTYWRQAHEQHRHLLSGAPPDPLVQFTQALCCFRLMDSRADDPYYREAVALFDQVNHHLGVWVARDSSGGLLQETLTESERTLALCHWKAGQAVLAEKCYQANLGPGKGSTSLPDDPSKTVRSLDNLLRMASALRELNQAAAGLEFAHEAADLLRRLHAAPIRAGQSRDWLAEQLVNLAALLNQLGQPEESLVYAKQGLHLCEQLVREAPEQIRFGMSLSSAWERVAKARWVLGQADEALAAFRESAAAQRRVLDLSPADYANRLRLSHCYGRIAYWSGLRGDWASAFEARLEQEKLWPNDAGELRKLADELQALAQHLDAGSGRLTAAVLARRQQILAASERIRSAAQALASN
jgi:hypothetical protein